MSDLMEQIAEEAQAYCAERKELLLQVGITHEGERQYRSFRSPDAQWAEPATETSIMEIGSFSKIYTCALLVAMEAKGMIGLDDTIATYLPEREMPAEVAAISVRDLATHSAGFDRIGKVFAKMVFEDVRVCYLRYRKEDLYEELRIAELARPRQSGWEYSIIGMSVLGHLLELAGAKPYEELLVEHVCGPLGLSDTRYNLSDEQLERVARGYCEDGQPAPMWYWDVMLPQGGLRSSMHDMLTFAEANLSSTGPLAAPLARSRQQHYQWPDGYEVPNVNAGLEGFGQGLGWWLETAGPHGTTACHAGATLSFQSFLGVNPQTNTGFVAMTSSEKNLLDLEAFSPTVARWMRQSIATHAVG